MFAVIYQWRITPGKEKEFESVWNRGSKLIYKKYGSLGSSLHKTADGTYIAYARWPSRGLWVKMMGEENKRPDFFWENHVKDVRPHVELELLNDLLKTKSFSKK